jgi:hypothetical protein
MSLDAVLCLVHAVRRLTMLRFCSSHLIRPCCELLVLSLCESRPGLDAFSTSCKVQRSRGHRATSLVIRHGQLAFKDSNPELPGRYKGTRERQEACWESDVSIRCADGPPQARP